jgi:hypothetical protein
MEHTLDDLKKKTVEELREIAGAIEDNKIADYETLEKDDLVKSLTTALGLEAKPKTPAAPSEKAKIKTQIQALKTKRAAAVEAHDGKQLKWMRLNIRRLKQKMRRASA